MQAPYFQGVYRKERRPSQQTHRLDTVLFHSHSVAILQFTCAAIQSSINCQIAISKENSIRLHKHRTGIRRSQSIAQHMSCMEWNFQIKSQREQETGRVARPRTRRQWWMTQKRPEAEISGLNYNQSWISILRSQMSKTEEKNT